MDLPITQLKEARAELTLRELDWHDVAQGIAEEFSCPSSEVEHMLSIEAHQLGQDARIKDFVPLLAIKQVKDLLRLSQHPSLPTSH